MSDPQPGPHGAGASFSSLPADVVAEIACALAANELCRIQLLDRSINNTLRGLVSPAVDAAQQAPTRPRGLHYFSILELRTRAEKHVPLDKLPLFSSAFETPPAPEAPAAAAAADNDGEQAAAAADAGVEDAVDNGAQQQQQQQQQPALQPANHPAVQEEVAAEVRPHLKALTAAALLGGWWGDAEQGAAARAAGLAAVGDAMGGDVAACVDKITESAVCPAAAKGFWGCITLALLMSTTSAATIRGAATLVQQLLNIGRPDGAIPASLVPALAPDIQADAAADYAAVVAPVRNWLQPAPSRYLYYQIREYLSALLMLLRCKPLLMPGLVDQGALEELRYQVFSEMLHHKAKEDDAATLALQGMPGAAGYQQQDEQLLRKMGLRQGQQLTAEQVRVLHRSFSAVGQGQRISVSNAFAGTAKSTTLLMMMHAFPHLRILYTAFNNTVVNDAKAHAPPNVDCKTTHALASAKMHELKARNNWYLGGGWTSTELKEHLNRLPFFALRIAQQGDKGAAGWPHVSDLRDTLNCFLASGDDWIQQHHVPELKKLLVPIMRQQYVPIAQQFWSAFVQNRLVGKVTFTHNCYLKMFQLDLSAKGVQLCDAQGRPYDAILVDEAQDMNGVTMALLLAQPCTQLWAGDRHQHIYTFNFCIDALSMVAQRPGSQHLPLSQSFRLGPQVAEVANRILWMLGERSRALVGKGFDHAAVYVFRTGPPAQQQQQDNNGQGHAAAADGAGAHGAGAAAAGGAGGGNAAGAAAAANPPGAFRQVQLLRDPIPPTVRTPEGLGSITVEIKDNREQPIPVSIAVPPVDPSTGRRIPLAYICRCNSTWVQIAAALVSRPPVTGAGGDVPGAQPGSSSGGSSSSNPANAAAGAGGAAAGRQGVRLYLSAYNPTTRRIEFLEDRVLELYKFWAGQVSRFRQYNSWKDVMAAGNLDPDLNSAVTLVMRYGPATPRIVQSIVDARVNSKADADYILGTCHKAKGTEEGYVQLADDFSPIANGMNPDMPVDDYNLLYVAATRAKVALVCNRDVQQMLLRAAEMRPVLVQPPPAQAADGDGPQQRCIGCAELRDAADAAENAGGVRIGERMWPGGAAGAQVPAGYDLCAACVRRETIWGQLTPQA